MSIQDLVPCILVTFDKEQIVIWRGNDYKPLEDGFFLTDRESFDSTDCDLSINAEGHNNPDDCPSRNDFYSGDED